jgi:hypothetical protein
MRRGALVAVLFALAGCASPGTRAEEPEAKLHEVSATVLEDESHGPEICLGIIAISLPPGCGGVPLIGWDWNVVEDEEAMNGVTWGRYRIVGTYDGESFTVAEVTAPDSQGAEDEDYGFDTPCEEPPGGWERPDPARTTMEDYDAAIAAAAKEQGYSIAWIDAPLRGPEGEPWQDIPAGVINAAFTGDLETHEAELRKHWGGALCVIKHDRSNADRERISEKVETFLKQRGLHIVFGAGSKGALDLIEVTVVYADQEDWDALDARFGKDAVVLISEIKPVS